MGLRQNGTFSSRGFRTPMSTAVWERMTIGVLSLSSVTCCLRIILVYSIICSFFVSSFYNPPRSLSLFLPFPLAG